MNLRRLLTTLLLVFVAVSIGYLIVTESRQAPSDTASPVPTANVPEDQVIAYYFHGNVRCPTCRKIEAYSQEAVESAFAEELKTGKLVWRVVNVEDSGNDHFVSDFQLTTRSLVLADMHGATQRQWKSLDRVWELVSDKASFMRYVRDEVGTYLRKEH